MKKISPIFAAGFQSQTNMTSGSPLLDHYSSPRNVGSMSKTDNDVGTGLVGAPACGDVMKLQIRVDPNNNTISDVKFKTFGCGSAIASSSYLTELVRGMTLEDAGRIRNTEIARELCLPPVKREFDFTFFFSLSSDHLGRRGWRLLMASIFFSFPSLQSIPIGRKMSLSN